MCPLYSWYPDIRAVRISLASAAVAGLVVIAACTDSVDKNITAPKAPAAPLFASGSSGGFGNAKHVIVCVGFGSPAGNYTFVNTNENNRLALVGNGFHFTNPPFAFDAWKDEGDGGGSVADGGGVTVFNDDGGAAPHVAPGAGYPVTPQPALNSLTNCVLVADRTVANVDYDPNSAIEANRSDSYAGVTITHVSNSVGATYDHTDCLLDIGVVPPQHTISPLPAAFSTGATYAVNDRVTTNTGNKVWRALAANGPSATVPAEGATWTNAGASGDCGTTNNPTRAFANFEHGTVVTFFFTAAPTTSTGQIAPTQTTCEDYAKGTSSALDGIMAGFKGTKIHNLAPGVFFYYASVTKGAGQSVGTTQGASPNPGGLPSYLVHQGQAYLYTFNGSSCTRVATLAETNGGATVLGGTSLPAGNYILGIKFNTGNPAGTVVPSASLTNSGSLLSTHNFRATVNGGSVSTTAASINTNAK